jgi:hypothetical protein
MKISNICVLTVLKSLFEFTVNSSNLLTILFSHDLRKFKQYQVVSDEFKCSTHVRSKMDGKWTEKLREMCATYSNYMDVQYLLNEYLKGIGGISNYLCRNDGIFRDCSSLNFQNTSINPEQKDVALTTCD